MLRQSSLLLSLTTLSWLGAWTSFPLPAGGCTIWRPSSSAGDEDISENKEQHQSTMSDVTDKYYLDQEQVVKCHGDRSCEHLHMQDCPVVECVGSEACFGVVIDQLGESLSCEGRHSCHMVNATMATTAASSSSSSSIHVACNGEVACDVAHFFNPEHVPYSVDCEGIKACRKARIYNASTVVCSNPDIDRGDEACWGSTTIVGNCLRCESGGCKPYINHCSMRPTMEAKREKCVAEGTQGNCS